MPSKPYPEMTDDELRLDLGRWKLVIEIAPKLAFRFDASIQCAAIVRELNRRGLAAVNKHPIRVG